MLNIIQPRGVAIVDDHALVRKGLVKIINEIPFYKVVMEASNGKEFLDKVSVSKETVEIVMLDINMPVMDGYETSLKIREYYREMRTIALTMNADEASILKMIRCGAKGYLFKDTEVNEIKCAFEQVILKGYYFNHQVREAISKNINNEIPESDLDIHVRCLLTSKEIEFLTYLSSDRTIKEISEETNISPRTIEWYKERLLMKLNVKSRIGLALFAMKWGVIKD